MSKKKRSQKQGGKVVLIPELRESLIPFLTHAELNGIILSEYRMTVYSVMQKHQPDLNSATVRSLTILLNESDTVDTGRSIEGVKTWAKGYRKKLGI